MPTLYVIGQEGPPRGAVVPVDYPTGTSPEEVARTYRALEEMLRERDPLAAEAYAQALGAREVALPAREREYEVWTLPRTTGDGEVGVMVAPERGSLHAFTEVEGERHAIALRFEEGGQVAIAVPPEVYARLTGRETAEPFVGTFTAEQLGLPRESVEEAARYFAMESRLAQERAEGWLSPETLAYLEERERLEGETKGTTGRILQALESEMEAPLASPDRLPVRREEGTIVDDRGNREGYYLLEFGPDGRVEKVVVSSGEVGDVARGEWYGEAQQRAAQETAQALRHSGREEEVAERIHPNVGEEERERERAHARLGGLTPPEREEEPEL